MGKIGTRLPFGRPEDNLHRAQRFTCDMLGECDLGCRLGAQHSLDSTYLSEIPAPSEIRTGAEVIAFRPVDIGFEIDYLDHLGEDSNTPPPRTTVTAGKLVLAAGTLGTALLMLRRPLALPGVSPHLGRQFCGNGDYLAFAAGCKPARTAPRSRSTRLVVRSSPLRPEQETGTRAATGRASTSRMVGSRNGRAGSHSSQASAETSRGSGSRRRPSCEVACAATRRTT